VKFLDVFDIYFAAENFQPSVRKLQLSAPNQTFLNPRHR